MWSWAWFKVARRRLGGGGLKLRTCWNCERYCKYIGISSLCGCVCVLYVHSFVVYNLFCVFYLETDFWLLGLEEYSLLCNSESIITTGAALLSMYCINRQ